MGRRKIKPNTARLRVPARRPCMISSTDWSSTILNRYDRAERNMAKDQLTAP